MYKFLLNNQGETFFLKYIYKMTLRNIYIYIVAHKLNISYFILLTSMF